MANTAYQLEVVGEELRVADEELRAQQELIEELLRGSSAQRLGSLRMMSALPIAVVETDPNGLILRANPGAAALFGVPSDQLHRRPLPVMIEPADRRMLRTALTQVVTHGGTEHVSVAVVPRRDRAVPVDMAVIGRTGEPSATGPGGRTAPSSTRATRPAAPAVRLVIAPRHEDQSSVEAALLGALGEVCTLSVVDCDLRTALTRLAALAASGITPAAAASLVVGAPAEPAIVVSTDSRAQTGDGEQFQANCGPSWDAYSTRGPVVSAAIHKDDRWPALARPPTSSETGADAAADAVAALPLPCEADGDAAGVLTLYGSKAVAEPASVHRAALFADAATALLREHVAVAELRTQEAQLREALNSRAVIDQAKGILMGRRGIDADAAFAVLATHSQHNNIKVRALAHQLVAEVTGASPQPATVCPTARHPTSPLLAGLDAG